jgi:hypothetical protein
MNEQDFRKIGTCYTCQFKTYDYCNFHSRKIKNPDEGCKEWETD